MSTKEKTPASQHGDIKSSNHTLPHPNENRNPIIDRADVPVNAPGKRARIREAVEALGLLDDGSVEVRVIGGQEKLSAICCTIEDIQEAGLAGVELGANVYFCTGVIGDRKPHKLKSGPAVKDSEITAYREVKIDIDPVRPVGVASTREELQGALDLAVTIISELILLGFPRPTAWGSSGNGAHVIYRLSLPVSDRPLVERWLETISRAYSTSTQHVDTVIGNPSRIWRLPGTVNRKGKPTADRPHRQAVLLPLDLLPESDAPPLTRETLVAVLDKLTPPVVEMERTPAPVRMDPVAPGEISLSGKERAERWVDARPPSVQGNQGDAHLRDTALALIVNQGRYGLSASEVTNLLLDRFNPRCSPPFSLPEVAAKVRNAWAYASARGLFVYEDDARTPAVRTAPRPINSNGNGTARIALEPVAGAQDCDGWGRPAPLKISGLPDFPIDVLPAPARAMAEALARETEAPLAYPATCILGVLGAALAGHVKVRIQGSWFTEAYGWPCVVGPPGSGKSPNARPCTAPVRSLQRHWADQSQARISDANARREIAEAALKAARRELEKTPTCLVAQTGFRKAQDALDLCQAAHAPRVLFNDSSNEALIEQLARNHGIAAYIADETGFLASQMGTGSGQDPNIDPLLAGYDFDRYESDRIRRGYCYIPETRIVLCAMPQPYALRKLLADERLAERGFIDRFLLAWPDEKKDRTFDGEPVSQEVSDAYDRWVTDLLIRSRGNDGTKPPARLIVGLTPSALSLAIGFRRRLESTIGAGRRYDPIRAYIDKATDKAVRLAAMFWASEVDPSEGDNIPAEYLERGIRLVEDFYLPHAEKVFGLEPVDADTTHARAVLAKMVSKGLRSETLDHIRRSTRIPSDALHGALDLLEERGWVRCVQEGTTGRPRYRYHLHPQAAELLPEVLG